ncbi:hypothetical protein ACHAXS_005861 [Conticribra weissflogii]
MYSGLRSSNPSTSAITFPVIGSRWLMNFAMCSELNGGVDDSDNDIIVVDEKELAVDAKPALKL